MNGHGIIPLPAPFAHDQEGPFPDVPMGGPIYQDDGHYGSPRQENYGNDRQWNQGYEGDYDDGKEKKNKKNKGGQTRGPPVQIHYEGYILEKTDPYPGEKSTWSRVGKRSMIVGEKSLQEIVRKHRLKTRSSPHKDLFDLKTNQQGTINLLLQQRQNQETQKNAEWILADVQCEYKGVWTKGEVKKIQVILKRQEKFQIKDKDKEKLSRPESKSYQQHEILDLDNPPKKKDKKNKAPRRTQSFDDLDHVVNVGQGLGIDHGFQPPPMPHHNQSFQQMPFENNHMPPPPPPHPMNGHFEPQGAFPPPPGQFARHESMRGPHFQNQNPFQPHDQHNVHGHMESHSVDDEYDGYSPRERTQSQRRQSSSRRKSVDTRQMNEINDKLDALLRDRNGDGSSQDSYGNDSMWSRDGRGYSDATGPTHYSRGSLSRTRSNVRPKYRSHRYSDADVEPAYTYRGERRYSSRPSRRPTVHRAETYDDYPMGRGAEPRFAPAPLSRRITYHDGGYEDDFYDDGPRGPQYDGFQQGYEAAQRDERRRRRSMRYG